MWGTHSQSLFKISGRGEWKGSFLHSKEKSAFQALRPEILNRLSERIDTQLALAALEMAYRRRKPPKGSIPPGPRRSAMCLPIWSLSTIPAALTPLWVGFLPLVSRRNFATPLPNHRYHIPHQSFQVFSYFSVRFSGNGSKKFFNCSVNILRHLIVPLK